MAMMIYKVYPEAVVAILKDRASRFSYDRNMAKEAFDAEHNAPP
jgi:hypothetical protein